MNNGNLIRNDELTPKERRERASKAGKASAEARRRKKALRECLTELLEKEYATEDGSKISGADLISVKLFRRAVDGDIKAFEIIRDTTGQKPVERVESVEISPEVYERVQKALES